MALSILVLQYFSLPLFMVSKHMKTGFFRVTTKTLKLHFYVILIEIPMNADMLICILNAHFPSYQDDLTTYAYHCTCTYTYTVILSRNHKQY